MKAFIIMALTLALFSCVRADVAQAPIASGQIYKINMYVNAQEYIDPVTGQRFVVFTNFKGGVAAVPAGYR